MTVLRSREIIPSPKTTPKSNKSTQNDTMADHIEPCTPNQPDPDPRPAPPPRRSLRLTHQPSDEPDPPILNASDSVEPRVEGFVEASESDGARVPMSLRSGRKVGRRSGDGEGKGKRKIESDSGEESGVGGCGRRRLSEKDMGKGKLGEEGSSSGGNGSGDDGGQQEIEDVDLNHNLVLEMERENRERNNRMEIFRESARRSAAHFAHFNNDNEEFPVAEGGDRQPDVGDWPGPFSTAWNIIRDREKRSAQLGFTFSAEGKPEDVEWVPKTERGCRNVVVPSLEELALKGLLNFVDDLGSLDIIPDSLKSRMCKLLSDSRRLNGHFFRLLLQGSPLEIRVSDCSWLTEEELMDSIKGFDSRNLKVLQLDLCGRCLPDYVMLAILAESSNNFPVLNTVSLSGACRLSDDGVKALVSSAPALTSINLSQCSLLTHSSIDAIANSLGSILRKLYLDDCQGIDPKLMLPALKKFEQLETLSIAGIESVSDEFIIEFVSICGHNMMELILTDCIKLTDSSMKVIAEKCPSLCSIDISKCKLTDSSLEFLANGCQSIKRLRLRGIPFSDQSIAAYVEAAGGCLEELSLNTVKKVGCQTALSIARRAGMLQSLDLSWCRDLTDNALGLIVDNCLALRVLKLFGCTQITDVFLSGHSNPDVKIIGLKLSPLLEEACMPNP